MTTSAIEFSERLRPSALTWVLAPVAAAMAGLSAVPLGAVGVVIAVVVFGAIAVALLAWQAPTVTVDATGFRAGRAFLEARYLGEIEPLDAAQTRQAMGPGLRADAYVVHRSWIPTAVRVGVADDADTTPYWLVSTRRQEELASALLACRANAQGGRQDQAAHSEQTG